MKKSPGEIGPGTRDFSPDEIFWALRNGGNWAQKFKGKRRPRKKSLDFARMTWVPENEMLGHPRRTFWYDRRKNRTRGSQDMGG